MRPWPQLVVVDADTEDVRVAEITVRLLVVGSHEPGGRAALSPFPPRVVNEGWELRGVWLVRGER